MDIGKTLTSAPVLIGGVAIGVILLAMKGSGGGGGDVVSVDNNAMFGYLASLNDNAVAIENARLNYQARNADSYRSTVVGLLGAMYHKDIAVKEIDAGVDKAQIVAATARDMDIRANDTRLKLAEFDYATAKLDNKTAVKITKEQVKGAVKTAKISARASVNAAQIDAKAARDQINTSFASGILDNLFQFGGALLPVI